ncbi:p53-like transcription factor [Rhizodiscina lignyota]|uniref:P53-like transcription factor n=1 Tax=Rhizodiscina lignyota TaxID=1504668 RepID=A0A9P4IF90_9PEZI|nr:p53-like transcription factor [Rhizodiscina lignyota]
MSLSPTATSAPAYSSAYTAMPSNEGQNVSPPFDAQKNFGQIITTEGAIVMPRIDCKVEKGFFLSGDQIYTCYRRNYFSVQCSYNLEPYPSDQQLRLDIDGKRHNINAFAVTLTAAVDGASGKNIELVQYTPKRDQGEKLRMEKQKLLPSPPGSARSHHDPQSFYPQTQYPGHLNIRPPYLRFQDDATSGAASHHGMASSPNALHHTFERVQFKSATANNGKRRAQQQFYHLTVELHADIRSHADQEPVWKKIGQRTSSPVVVRGRSPSHYQREDPANGGNPNRGGAGGAGAGGSGGGNYGFGSGGSSLGGSLSRGYSVGATGIHGTYSHLSYGPELAVFKEQEASVDSSSGSDTASPNNVPVDKLSVLPALHLDGMSKVLEPRNYSYFSGPLHSIIKSNDRSVKDEYVLTPATTTTHGTYLPSSTNTCGRFIGASSSLGHYSADTAQY